MKNKFRFMLTAMMLAMVCTSFFSCSKDDDPVNEVIELTPEPTPADAATTVAGSYAGMVYQKWYESNTSRAGYVTLTRLSSNVVRVTSLISEGWGLDIQAVNLTASNSGGVITLKSETNYLIDGTYSGGKLQLNFEVGSYSLVFSGYKN